MTDQQDTKLSQLPTISDSVIKELEILAKKKDRLHRNKKNALYQQKQVLALPMFLGWNEANLAKAKADVEYFEERGKVIVENLEFSKKSLDTSLAYVQEHGDDEDKAKLTEQILKKIEKVKKQQAELQEEYEAAVLKEREVALSKKDQ